MKRPGAPKPLAPRDQAEAGGGDPLDNPWRQAELALDSALTQFKAAAAAVIDRIKAGECLPKLELDREWQSPLQLIKARQRSAARRRRKACGAGKQ